MTFAIDISARAEDFLRKRPKNDREILLRKIYALREHPYPHLKRLQGSKLWRLRVMDYRVIVDIIVKANRIYVVRIGLRENVYDA